MMQEILEPHFTKSLFSQEAGTNGFAHQQMKEAVAMMKKQGIVIVNLRALMKNQSMMKKRRRMMTVDGQRYIILILLVYQTYHTVATYSSPGSQPHPAKTSEAKEKEPSTYNLFGTSSEGYKLSIEVLFMLNWFQDV